ncbi:MAG: hypothetical protein HQK55_07980 [Deltaproteobacteria bacterium]|nr:hypothetical protein [Deltaproteobacteria bacterium]
MVVVKMEIARGWKEIGIMIGTSEQTAKRLFKQLGLPVQYELSTPTLANTEYLDWRKKQQKSLKNED